MATNYKQRKERARREAIDWQLQTAGQPMTWSEAADWAAHFEALARRYGLILEFRENAII